MGMTTKTKACKELTIPQATSSARRLLDRHMPGAGGTVNSSLTVEVGTGILVVRTHVTFPHMHPGISALREALCGLAGIRDCMTATSSITITRTVR